MAAYRMASSAILLSLLAAAPAEARTPARLRALKGSMGPFRLSGTNSFLYLIPKDSR